MEVYQKNSSLETIRFSFYLLNRYTSEDPMSIYLNTIMSEKNSLIFETRENKEKNFSNSS